MAKDHYFDITAKLDMQEMKNAIVMAQKEVDNRYDFKGLTAEINWNESAKVLTLLSSSDNKIDALKDILIAKMVKRNLVSNVIEEVKTESASGGNVKVIYRIIDSIEKDEAKKIVKDIKSLKKKVQATVQGDEVRVSAKSIDDLQAVMKHLRAGEYKAPISFGNFK
jgi:uncharacterized protein YajQ (UPF0234 family)